MKSKTTTLGPFVRLVRGLEYTLVIQRGKGRNAEFIAGVHFAGNQRGENCGNGETRFNEA